MNKISYINGQYVAHQDAYTHIEDRGYQFSDGVYEVMAIRDGVILDYQPHIDRLINSLDILEINLPMPLTSLKIVMHELLRRNKTTNDAIYIQITRGVSARNHAFPGNHANPILSITLLGNEGASREAKQRGISVITMPDIRWGRRDVKSISLLPNILAKQNAIRQQANEAWLVNQDGNITEGSSSNSYIMRQDGTLQTHPKDQNILGGITRDKVLDIARSLQISIDETAYSKDDISDCAEAFVTSTTMGVMPVTNIEGKSIPVGKITQKLMDAYEAA